MSEPKRDRWGRYLIKPHDGGKAVAHTRCTTVAKALDDEENLTPWKMRHAAKGLALREDLYALAAATPLTEKGTFKQLCEDAMEASGANARRNLGTALHSFTESVDRGEEDPLIPAKWQPDVAAYRECLGANGIVVDPRLIEVIAVCDALPEPVAGTIDRIVSWQGKHLIADTKTGSDLRYSWRSIAVQLAIYSRSKTLYDPETETHDLMPEVRQDYGIVFHLPAGEARCVPYLVDLEAGWEAAQQAVWTRGWRKRDNLATALEAA